MSKPDPKTPEVDRRQPRMQVSDSGDYRSSVSSVDDNLARYTEKLKMDDGDAEAAESQDKDSSEDTTSDSESSSDSMEEARATQPVDSSR